MAALTSKQRLLATAMSKLSERAYSASWIDCLEFLLWDILESEGIKIGRATLSNEEKTSFRLLSKECGGWIVFDNIQEETFIEMPHWLEVYRAWSERRNEN